MRGAETPRCRISLHAMPSALRSDGGDGPPGIWSARSFPSWFRTIANITPLSLGLKSSLI
jgi:hypothetical protein